jgi:hypothetical protein
MLVKSPILASLAVVGLPNPSIFTNHLNRQRLLLPRIPFLPHRMAVPQARNLLMEARVRMESLLMIHSLLHLASLLPRSPPLPPLLSPHRLECRKTSLRPMDLLPIPPVPRLTNKIVAATEVVSDILFRLNMTKLRLPVEEATNAVADQPSTNLPMSRLTCNNNPSLGTNVLALTSQRSLSHLLPRLIPRPQRDRHKRRQLLHLGQVLKIKDLLPSPPALLHKYPRPRRKLINPPHLIPLIPIRKHNDCYPARYPIRIRKKRGRRRKLRAPLVTSLPLRRRPDIARVDRLINLPLANFLGLLSMVDLVLLPVPSWIH